MSRRPALAAGAGKAKFGTWGYDATSMDASVKPGDDFFKYVNGGWDKRTQIAPDRISAGVDVVLADQAERDVHKIVEDLAKDPGQGRPGRPAGSATSTPPGWTRRGIEARGTAPLKPYLARIAAAKTKADVAKLFAEPGFESPVNVGIGPDLDNPNVYVVGLDQSGLGLPNRDYYLREGAKYDGFRKAYRDYVIKIQTLAGIKNAAAKADAIIALEHQDRRGALGAGTHPRRRADQQPDDAWRSSRRLAPQFPWAAMFAARGPRRAEEGAGDRAQRGQGGGRLFAATPLAVWKDYLAYHFIRTHAAYLPHAFDQANFDFFSHTLRDVPEQRERWKRGVQLVNRNLGEEVGRIYVAEHFPPEAEKQTAELIANLTAAYGERFKKRRVDGRRRPARPRWSSSRPSIRASAIRRNRSTIRA